MNSTVDIVAWVPAPTGRGTIGLIWSCLATMLLCTWSAIHPNLPGDRESKRRRLARRALTSIACLCAPEYFAWIALQDLWVLRNMRSRTPQGSWSLKKCWFLYMGGYVIKDIRRDPVGPTTRIDTQILLELFEAGRLAWPSTSEEDIEDRSKADWVFKTLAMLQVFWFIANLAGRWAQVLAVTTLELYTLGIVICSVVVYSASWEKSFDVNVPVIVLDPSNNILHEQHVIERVRVHFDVRAPNLEATVLWAAIGLSLVFGAIHIAAWNFHFASFTEQLIWRITSVSCTAIPVSMFSILLLKDNIKNEGFLAYCAEALIEFGRVFYAICRLCLFVEMFTSLRAVRRSVY